jgi:hypothetical protein
MFLRPIHGERAAASEHDDKRLPRGYKRFEQFLLRAREIKTGPVST